MSVEIAKKAYQKDEPIYHHCTYEVVCPECGCEVGSDVNLADYHEYPVQCDECKYVFYLEVEVIVEYSTYADCRLNGAEHQWAENRNLTSGHSIYYRCIRCDATKQVPKHVAEDHSLQEELVL